MAENKAITQKQLYKRFLDYLQDKDTQNINTTKMMVRMGLFPKIIIQKKIHFFLLELIQ